MGKNPDIQPHLSIYRNIEALSSPGKTFKKDSLRVSIPLVIRRFGQSADYKKNGGKKQRKRVAISADEVKF